MNNCVFSKNNYILLNDNTLGDKYIFWAAQK